MVSIKVSATDKGTNLMIFVSSFFWINSRRNQNEKMKEKKLMLMLIKFQEKELKN
jgi:hypothetical protein